MQFVNHAPEVEFSGYAMTATRHRAEILSCYLTIQAAPKVNATPPFPPPPLIPMTRYSLCLLRFSQELLTAISPFLSNYRLPGVIRQSDRQKHPKPSGSGKAFFAQPRDKVTIMVRLSPTLFKAISLTWG